MRQSSKLLVQLSNATCTANGASKSIALCRFPSLKCWELCTCTTETVGTGAQLLRGSCVDVRLSLPQGISRGLSVAPLRSAGAQVALAVYGSSHLRLKLIVPSKLPFGLNSEQKEVNKTQCALSQPYLPHWQSFKFNHRLIIVSLQLLVISACLWRLPLSCPCLTYHEDFVLVMFQFVFQTMHHTCVSWDS